MGRRIVDLTDQRFGLLVARKRAGSTKTGEVTWLCDCDCGNTHIVSSANLRRTTRSCGCQHWAHVTKHGQAHTQLYRVWKELRRRCKNKNRPDYERYGGRGISVCSEWEDFTVFQEWALNSGYDPKLTIERIDNNGNYEPGNCKWATIQEQNNNTRQNVNIKIRGVTKTLKQWGDSVGLSYSTISTRYRDGWCNEDLILPKMKPHQRVKMG